MTITSFKEMSRGYIEARADGSLYGQILYLVTSDSVSESQVGILSHASCPDLHTDAHPDNANMICRKLRVGEYRGNDKKWVVTADFDSRVQFENIEYNFDNNVVKGGMRGITENVPTWWDTDGNPLVNDADDYYEGLTKRKRLVVVDVTAYFDSVPWALFTELNGTVNDDSVTIHGVTFRAGICLLDNPVMPDSPITTIGGDLLWPVQYDITIDPEGWVSVLPNRGFYHYLYQTRTSTSAPWEDSGYDAYTAEGTSNLKRRLKQVITEDGEADVPTNIWLNDHGEKILASLDVINTTCNTTAGSTTISSIAVSLTAADVGKYVVISGAGHQGRRLRARIESQAGSSAVISIAAKTSVTGGAIKGGGAYCKAYQIEDLADWTNLPLPNNHT